MRKFEQFIDLSNINDSMELDSGETIAYLKGDKYILELRVVGDVRVVYKENEVYKCASQMPDELLQMFHDGKITDDIYIDDSNWYELFVYDEYDNFIDSYLYDLESCSKEELEKYLNEEMDYYEKEYGTD